MTALLLLCAVPAQAQTIATPVAQAPPAPQARVAVPAQTAAPRPAAQTQSAAAPQPAPPVAAPFGGLYDTISGRSGASNCTPGLTPFNAATCK